MATKKQNNYLRRYTDLPGLLQILHNKKVSLLDFQGWDDKNDTFIMDLYKKKAGLKSLLALCFSETTETYHHWHVYSKGPAGVCIEFDRNKLISKVENLNGVKYKSVEYATLAKIKNYNNFAPEDLPFVKRHAYKPEAEFRIIYGSRDESKPVLNIEIGIDAIRKIYLSPWLNSALFDSVVNSIKAAPDCGELKISPSTLISNRNWREFGCNVIGNS